MMPKTEVEDPFTQASELKPTELVASHVFCSAAATALTRTMRCDASGNVITTGISTVSPTLTVLSAATVSLPVVGLTSTAQPGFAKSFAMANLVFFGAGFLFA